jgi:hypothetical protein
LCGNAFIGILMSPTACSVEDLSTDCGYLSRIDMTLGDHLCMQYDQQLLRHQHIDVAALTLLYNEVNSRLT